MLACLGELRAKGLAGGCAAARASKAIWGLWGRATLARSDLVIMREEFVDVVAEN